MSAFCAMIYYYIKGDKEAEYLQVIQRIKETCLERGCEDFALYRGTEEKGLFLEVITAPSREIYLGSGRQEDRARREAPFGELDEIIIGGLAKEHFDLFERVF